VTAAAELRPLSPAAPPRPAPLAEAPLAPQPPPATLTFLEARRMAVARKREPLAAGMARGKVRHGAYRLAYRVFGEGRPIVLVQGLGLPGAFWEPLVPGLVAQGYRVILPDNRGTGFSDYLPAPFSMAELGDELATVIDATCPDEAPLVVGLSMGGMIVQHLALRHPRKLRGLVLTGTSCGLPHSVLPAPKELAGLVGLFTNPTGPSFDQLMTLMAHRDAHRNMVDVFKAWQVAMVEAPTPPTTVVSQLWAATTHSTGRRLRKIRTPTYVLSGADDRVIPARNARILADRIPGASLEVVERAGHVVPFERPELFHRALQRLEARIHSTRHLRIV
jgi:3-oxoadipate enol-lactonase